MNAPEAIRRWREHGRRYLLKSRGRIDADCASRRAIIRAGFLWEAKWAYTGAARLALLLPASADDLRIARQMDAIRDRNLRKNLATRVRESAKRLGLDRATLAPSEVRSWQDAEPTTADASAAESLCPTSTTPSASPVA